MSEMPPAEIRIYNARLAIYAMHMALQSFVLAYEERNEEQMLTAYHMATKALDDWDRAQAAIKKALHKGGE